MAKKEKADTESQLMSSALAELTERLDPTWLAEWTRQEEVAMEKRGEALKIYEVMQEKALSMAEIRLELAEEEVKSGSLSGVASILTEALNIERAQCVNILILPGQLRPHCQQVVTP